MLVSQTDFFQQIDNLTKEAPTEHVRFIANVQKTFEIIATLTTGDGRPKRLSM